MQERCVDVCNVSLSCTLDIHLFYLARVNRVRSAFIRLLIRYFSVQHSGYYTFEWTDDRIFVHSPRLLYCALLSLFIFLSFSFVHTPLLLQSLYSSMLNSSTLRPVHVDVNSVYECIAIHTELLYYYHQYHDVLLYLEFVEKIKRTECSVCIWTSCCFSVNLQTIENTLRYYIICFT